MDVVNPKAIDPKRDAWSLSPTMAAGGIAMTLLAGIALPLVGERWGLVFLLATPFFAWSGVRGSSLIPKATSLDVLRILAAFGPTEVYHFSAFHKSLEGLFALKTKDGLTFPDLRSDRDLAEAIFPEPTRFLRQGLALCSVIRPCNTENAGAVAAATGLVQSGLFPGQSQQFFDAVTALATAADRRSARALRCKRRQPQRCLTGILRAGRRAPGSADRLAATSASDPDRADQGEDDHPRSSIGTRTRAPTCGVGDAVVKRRCRVGGD
jgi:hypothetical protein